LISLNKLAGTSIRQWMTSLFREIEELIRSGKMNRAGGQLKKLSLSRLSRPDTYRAAALARQAGLPGLSVRLLNPFVRPKNLSIQKANDKEKALYAGALVRLGAVEEAETILGSIDAANAPEKDLFLTHALFAQWNYRDAIPALERLIASSEIEQPQRVAGLVNLAAAFVHEGRYEEAESVFARIDEETERSGLTVFKGNTLELRAQASIGKKDWAGAEKYLSLAEAELVTATPVEAYFVRKWRAILNLRSSASSSPDIDDIRKLRAEAVAIGHYESIRDCDLIISCTTQNPDLFLQVFFGTPFTPFRQMALARYARPLDIPDEYNWQLLPGGQSDDLLSRLGARRPFSKQGGVLARLTALFCTDFYRPFRLEMIHEIVYPNEYYNPQSSPNRVHQSVRLLRRWIAQNNLPLEVASAGAMYWLRAKAPYAIRVPRNLWQDLHEKSELPWLDLLPTGDFTSEDVVRQLHISDRSARRLLNHGVAAGRLERQGAGKSTAYRRKAA